MDDLFSYVPPAPPEPPSQREKGEAGMNAAADHAEAVEPGWKEEALEYVRLFAIENREREYLSEEVAPWAAARGCSAPPDKRAWGHAIKRAGQLGLIEKTGRDAKNQLSGNDSTYRPIWRAGRKL